MTGGDGKSSKGTARETALYLDLAGFVWVGLALIILVSPLFRGLFFEPDLVLVQVAAGAVGFFMIGDMILKKRGYRFTAMDGAALALCAFYFMAVTVAVDIRGAVTEAAKYLTYWILFAAAGYIVTGPREGGRLAALLWGAGVITAAVGIASALHIFDFPGAIQGRIISSTLQYKNAAGIYFLCAFILGLGLAKTSRGPAARVLVPAGNFILVLVLFNTFSRGAWMLMPLALLIYSVLLPREYQLRSLYHIFLTVGAGFLAGRYFVDFWSSGTYYKAGFTVLMGAGATAALAAFYDTIIHAVDGWRADDKVKRVVADVIGAFLVINIAAYVWYSYSMSPALSGEVVPGRMKARVATVHAGDVSYDTRKDYYRTALGIARDHPWLGTGGRGWASVYHAYQPLLTFSTEVHSHYLQVLVETGVPGLAAYLALWALAGRAVYRAYRAYENRKDKDGWVILWSAAAAAIALGIHSAWDFDLSLPALAIFLWLLFGLVKSSDTWSGEQQGTPARRWPAFVLVGLLSAAVAIFAWRLNIAGHLGAEAARAMNEGNLYLAERNYVKAAALDPLQATYRADLAQIYAVSGLKQEDPILIDKAWKELDKAVRLKPYDPFIRSAIINTAQILQDRERALKEARFLIEANPLDVTNYEIVCDLSVVLALEELEQGEPGKAARRFDEVLQTLDSLQDNLAEFHRRYPAGAPYWQGRPLAVTDRLMLRQAQALAARGKYDTALSLFGQVKGDKNPKLREEARVWTAAVYTLKGDEAEAARITQSLSGGGERAGRLVELMRRFQAAAPEPGRR